MDILHAGLRLIHILSGVFWVGFAVFVPFYLAPAIQDVGPDGGKVLVALQKRGLLTVLPVLALLTLLSGAWLYWRDSGGRLHEFAQTGFGMTLFLGALSAIVAYAIGMAYSRPAMLKAMALMQSVAGAASDEERGRIMQQAAVYRTRGANGTRIVAVLLILATAAMALARFVP
jgi:hypothetical protein